MKETRFSFKNKQCQNRRVSSHAQYCHRDAIHFGVAARIDGFAITGADTHAVIGGDFVNGHVDGDEQTNDCKYDCEL